MNALSKEFLTTATPAAALRTALEKVAPQWPLKSFVAVNPFLGYADMDITTAARRLALTHRATILPQNEPGVAIDTLAGLFGRRMGFDGEALATDAVSKWAASYFDLHRPIKDEAFASRDPFSDWREDALIDLTPEIWGARRFRADVKNLPSSAARAAQALLDELDLPEDGQSLYLDRLVGSIPGWTAYARHFDWTRARDGEDGAVALGVLTVRLAYDVLLGRRLDSAALNAFKSQLCDGTLALDVQREPDADLYGIEASETSFVARTIASLKTSPKPGASPLIQAVFCIDVRSERMRRHLELASSQLQTHGFAGFFGLPVAIERDGTKQPSCPPLLRPAFVCEAVAPAPPFASRLSLALQSLKAHGSAAFAYVEALGATALAPMIGQALGLPPTARKPAPLAMAPLDDFEEILSQCAAGFLKASGLGDRLAPRVLLLGHEAHSANNPHAAGLQCGACGGRSGADNARVMAQTLNHPGVRARMAASHGLVIPDATLFVAGVHNTTTDEITLFDADADDALRGFHAAAELAGQRTRAERALLLNEHASLAVMRRRGRDPSQTLPEWGLAGCAGFIAAPRRLTREKDLEGRVFLHDYDQASDPDGVVLEQILTAPVIVASWINLQYFASSQAPKVFGAGDKVLHNIVGHGAGVIEGNGGDLRLGLPYQSVHDASGLRYPAQRLSVFIAASQAAIERVLQKHKHLRDLVENRWIRLFALDEDADLHQRTRSGWTQSGWTRSGWGEASESQSREPSKTPPENRHDA